VKDVRDAQMLARTSDGRLVRRPLSPHLQVYRPQITTVISILHRITGIGLGVGTLLLTWWLVAAATSAEAFAAVEGFIGSPLGLLLLLGWTFALFFHLSNGIRHLAWDLGLGFEKAEYHLTGWAVVAAAAILTVLAWIVGVVMW
jgi:succinate dehydrogenase / fumarate reductase cytochrome b subunit